MFKKFIKYLPKIRQFSSENIVKSRAKPIEIPNVTICDYLWENLDKWADKTAVVCAHTKREYSFYEVYKNSQALAHYLRTKAQLNADDTVAIVLPNVPEYAIVLLGAIQAGLRVTTCNPAYTHYEITQQMANCNTKLVFTNDDLLPKIGDCFKAISINGNNYEQIVENNEKYNNSENTNLESVPLLLYSSGTTGLPKGVQLTHRNIVSNLCQADAEEFNLSSNDGNDVIPVFLPLFHTYGLTQMLLLSIRNGRKMVTVSHFSTQNFIYVLKQFKPTILFTAPLMVNMMINHPQIKSDDLNCLKHVLCGAAPLGALDIQRFNEKTKGAINIQQIYGMTETSPLTLMQTNKLNNGVVVGGAGLLVPNTEAKILPLDGGTEPLPSNKSGELVFKGPQIMKGYLNNDEANNEVFLDNDWLKTGDIGYYDENGHFFITDRLKELIKVKGFQVAPAELEEILRNHPDVDDVAVVGVPHDYLGEAPRAFIVLKKKARTPGDEIREYVAKKVAKHKRLEGGITFVDNIPKNPSGKILRKELKKLYT